MASVPLIILKKVFKTFKKHSAYKNLLETRRRFRNRAVVFNLRVPGYQYEWFKIGNMKAEWIKPNGADQSKVLLFFHGGGYAVGSIETHRALVSQIAKNAGILGLQIEYRLAPEHTYPAPIEDAVQAYQWLIHNGFHSSDIAFGGDSAGGGICIGTLLYLRDHNIPMPKCAIALSPWLDHSLSGESYHSKKDEDPLLIHEGFPIWSKSYMGDADPKSPYASPIFYDLKGLPPIFVQVGSAEMLLDDSTRFAAKAKADGVDINIEIYPEKFHVFQAFWLALPKARQANRKLGEFLRKHLTEAN